MAKKAVATFKKGDGRTYSKVIKMVKSPKTFPPGAVPPEQRQLENRGMMCFVAVRLQ